MEDVRLTPRGRAVADRVAACHFDVEVERAFDRRDDCEAVATSHGLDVIDAGHKRRAYRLPGRLVDGDRACTLKVAYSLNGYYENRCEVAWWREMPDGARHLFAPVLDYDPGYGWVLMPGAERDLTEAERREVEFALGDAGWVGEDVTKPAQYGRVDGDPVVVDYGRADFLDPTG